MRTVMTILFTVIVLFDIFMATPLGAIWISKNMEEGRPCYGVLIAFGTAISLMIIGGFLGIIK